jgi:hypothetical protein
MYKNGAIRSATGDPFSDTSGPRMIVRVDTGTRLVERVTIVQTSLEEGPKSRVLVRYGSEGAIPVERPDGIPPVSVASLLCNLADGPLFSQY